MISIHPDQYTITSSLTTHQYSNICTAPSATSTSPREPKHLSLQQKCTSGSTCGAGMTCRCGVQTVACTSKRQRCGCPAAKRFLTLFCQRVTPQGRSSGHCIITHTHTFCTGQPPGIKKKQTANKKNRKHCGGTQSTLAVGQAYQACTSLIASIVQHI